MTETQELLTKIAALRQRLEQAQGLANDAGSAATALLEKDDILTPLRANVDASARQQSLVDTTLRQLPMFTPVANDKVSLPAQLTSRAARLRRRASESLGQLRSVADDPALTNTESGPLPLLHREAFSMTEAVLRTVEAFPEAPSAEVRLCEGLEGILNVVADRLAVIQAALQQRRRDMNRLNLLAELLTALAAGRTVEIRGLVTIAESIQEDALEGKALRFVGWLSEPSDSDMSRHVAAHCLVTAQVIARLIRQDAAWRGKALEPILAALVHDVGMLKMPAALLTLQGLLNDDQRRQLETHPLLGAEMAARITPSANWLIEAAGQHHERLDGTGYPAGLRDLQIKPLIRLLSVCDVYAAMCQPRNHRQAHDTRTALADTLLLAEQGGLDRNEAEKLLCLSFYPIGSVVELSDGAIGVVVATHKRQKDLNSPPWPVVALLTDSLGHPFPGPRFVDLSEIEGCSILRGLPVAERRERLGRRYPDLAGW